MTAKAKGRAVKAPKPGPSAATDLRLEQGRDETRGQLLARASLGPLARHAVLASSYAGGVFKSDPEMTITDVASFLRGELTKVHGGDLGLASWTLAAQAVTLDAIFTELAKRSHLNMGEYLDASERYMRLALKAQAASRATLEALARLHQPREQTVRHVHVNSGGRAVVADQFHHHAGGENEKAGEQSHATAIPR